MGESRHIVDRNFEMVCSGIFRLIDDPVKLRKYRKYLLVDLFFKNDSAQHIKALRRIIRLVIEVHDEGNSQSISRPYIETKIGNITEMLDADVQQLRGYFRQWSNNKEIQKKVNDEGNLELFLDYLKTVQIAKIAKSFSDEYHKGRIDTASEIMYGALSEIDSIDKEISQTFDFEPLYDMLEKNSKVSSEQCFYLGCEPLDNIVGGFYRQTLNIFISPTNGGKTAMSHHLIRRCVETKTYAYVGVVEDRQESFMYKVTAAVTDIPISRLRKEFHLLTEKERDRIRWASQMLKEYIKVDFVFGSDIETVHKLALDYDTECDIKKRTKPIVNIVDYTMHIASRSRGDKGYEKIRNAYASRKDFCLKYDKIGFDFAQVNREGNKRADDEEFLTQVDLAGAYDLAQVCDNIISINRSIHDHSQFKAKLYVCKARDGATGICFRVGTEFHKARYNMEDCIVMKRE